MAIKRDLFVDQGANFTITLPAKYSNGTVVDLSDYTPRAKMRKHYNYGNVVNFTSSKSNNNVTISLSASQTNEIEVDRYVYDIEIENSSNAVIRLYEGIITVTPQVL